MLILGVSQLLHGLGVLCCVYHQCIMTDVILKVKGLCSCISFHGVLDISVVCWISWMHLARVPTVKHSFRDVCHNDVIEIITMKWVTSQYLIFHVYIRPHSLTTGCTKMAWIVHRGHSVAQVMGWSSSLDFLRPLPGLNTLFISLWWSPVS